MTGGMDKARETAWPPDAEAAEKPPLVHLLGLDFAVTTLIGAASWLGSRSPEAPFAYVVTPNADHLVRISRDPALLAIYRGALLCVMDSTVVAKASRLFRLPVAPVVRGTDLAAMVLTRHLRPGDRLTVIGMDAALIPRLEQRCAGVEVAHHNPPMGFDRDPAAFADAIRFAVDHPARVTVLAVGMPRQERLAAAIAATGQAVGIGLCVGSALEFLVGAHTRAPAWIQDAGFEWLYRLLREPRRLARRYLVQCPPIFSILLRERRRRGSLIREGDGLEARP